ncbi:MAG TPA: hypothetical protein VMB34_04765 [Acetobacteraceae bacterium]|nr:hypothetical protein [Acetobacteraceae bacterium]
MRLLCRVLLLLSLTGCAASPQALGITGPEGSTARPATSPLTEAPPSTDPLDNPDIMQSGGRYGPSYAPNKGSSGYWGYN